jgi:hypothetical protein
MNEQVDTTISEEVAKGVRQSTCPFCHHQPVGTVWDDDDEGIWTFFYVCGQGHRWLAR